MRKQSRFTHLLTLASLLAILAGVLPWAATPSVQAADGPTITITSATEHIDANATSFVVPIAFEDGSPDDQISSVNFVLDYAEACVRINNADSDITGVQSTFEKSFSNDADNGLLQVSIWHTGAQVALTSGALLSIRFTLEPACRQGPANLTDPTTAFSFSSATFGDLIGGYVEGTASGGTYTLDLNQAPTDISAGSLAMAENSGGDRQIAVFSASDSDATPADTLTYAFSAACTAPFNNQGFALDVTNSANLRTDRVFNFEAEDEYPICVQVSDGQGGVYSEKITLVVGDVNDTPTDIALSRNIITETAAVGDVVGFLSSSDDETAQDHTYALVAGVGATDNLSFTIEGAELRVTDPAIDYADQPEYKVRIEVTDSGSPARSYQKQFRLVVVGASTLALAGEPDLPIVLAGQAITLPVSITPDGNNVLTATFQVNYNEECLNYGGLVNLQSGYSNTAVDTEDDGAVAVSLSGGSAPLAPGVAVGLVFTGTACAPAQSWTDVTFDAAPTLLGAGGAALASAKRDGKLVVLANSGLGDCNADGSINAGDFSATALELFDIEERNGSSIPADSWLWTPLGSRGFSARGCDSNADRSLLVADLICTIRRSFGSSCTGSMGAADARGAAEPAIVSAPAAAALVAGQPSSVPLQLQTNGHDIAAFAASVSFDAAAFKLDPADGDGDGLPDAVHFQLPAGMYRMASYDAAAGRIDLVTTGLVMPLPTLQDGVFVTLDLTPVEGAAVTQTRVALSNLSLGDSEGGVVPAVARSVAVELPAAPLLRLFLPTIVH